MQINKPSSLLLDRYREVINSTNEHDLQHAKCVNDEYVHMAPKHHYWLIPVFLNTFVNLLVGFANSCCWLSIRVGLLFLNCFGISWTYFFTKSRSFMSAACTDIQICQTAKIALYLLRISNYNECEEFVGVGLRGCN